MTQTRQRQTSREKCPEVAGDEIAIPGADVRNGLIGDRGGVNLKARSRLKPGGNDPWIRDRLDGAL